MSQSEREYWTQRYEENRTGWDIGYASPALVDYVQTLDKDKKILIPGAGNAYEAEALWKLGYANLFVCDISELPLQALSSRLPDFPEEQLLCVDFFDLDDQFDVILEQTFFCSMLPKYRGKYVQKMGELLKKGGALSGLLFQHELNPEGNRPFGGNKEEYVALFSEYFEIKTMVTASNSITPRQGNELFIELIRK